MSVGYTCYLGPQPDHVNFSPTGSQLVAVIDLLSELRWTATAEQYIIRTSLRGSQGTQAIRAASRRRDVEDLLAGRGAFVMELPEIPDVEWWPEAPRDPDGSTRKCEFTDDALGVLQPRYCMGARLFWSPSVVSVPMGAEESSTVCPACGAEVLADIGPDDPAIGVLAREAFFLLVPENCGSCGAALTWSELVTHVREGVTGALVLETAPFGHFVIGLDAASPSKYPHGVEEPLLERLSNTLGVDYRNVGRWS